MPSPRHNPYAAPPRRPGRDVAVPADQRRFALSPEEERFADEFQIDLDPRASAARMGLPPDRGKVLLARPKVQDAIALRRRRRLGRLQIYGDEIVRRWAMLAAADPNEIAELRRVNCRHCHGVDHEHQYNDVELRHAMAAHRREMDALVLEIRELGGDPETDPRLVPFDEKGGGGFRKYAAPNPDCPVCDGEGNLVGIIKDSRNLSPAGKLLYDGFKTGPGGTIEAKLRDRSWAEQQLARHAGLFNERAPVDEFDPERMSDDQLDAALHALVERGAVEFEGADPDAATDADFEEVSPTSSTAPSAATDDNGES